MDVGEFNERRLYAGLTLDYRLRLWAPTFVSCAVSAVVRLLFAFDFWTHITDIRSAKCHSCPKNELPALVLSVTKHDFSVPLWYNRPIADCYLASSYASAAFGVVILSLCPSVCHTRALWQNQAMYCWYFDTTRKYMYNYSSCLTPMVIGGRHPLPSSATTPNVPTKIGNFSADD